MMSSVFAHSDKVIVPTSITNTHPPQEPAHKAGVTCRGRLGEEGRVVGLARSILLAASRSVWLRDRATHFCRPGECLALVRMTL